MMRVDSVRLEDRRRDAGDLPHHRAAVMPQRRGDATGHARLPPGPPDMNADGDGADPPAQENRLCHQGGGEKGRQDEDDRHGISLAPGAGHLNAAVRGGRTAAILSTTSMPM